MAPTRTAWIGGNWKCNGTKAGNAELAAAFNATEFSKDKIDVVIFPTALHLSDARRAFDPKICVGVQNLSRSGNGAFTGEISSEMAKDFGLEWALIGHSERRTLYGESDAVTAEKMAKAETAGLSVSFCIGETLEEREAGKTGEVCARQLSAVFPVIKNWSKVVIAYEPVWAIGTGKVASTAQAQEAHEAIRSLISRKVSAQVAEEIRIVYGGSVSEKNCEELMKMADIDGFLVGGASLKPTFTDIIQAGLQHSS